MPKRPSELKTGIIRTITSASIVDGLQVSFKFLRKMSWSHISPLSVAQFANPSLLFTPEIKCKT